MKIRNGFVSNSSSSSFCIYGFSEDEYDFKELIGLNENGNEYDLYEKLEDITKDTELDFWIPDGYERVYIGKSFSDIEDNETGLEFKKSVKDEIKKIFKTDIECSLQEEAYNC